MLVNTPPAIGHMVPHLAEFVEMMAAKLAVNSHKDAVAEKDVPILLDLMAKEVQELRDQVAEDEQDFNSLEETSDIGNFAFLLYAFLRSRGVRSATERFLDEFYDIRPEEGRIYCKKTRSGSAIKVGEEVTGTTRNGRVYIRAQHAITGAAISLPRANIIWWKAKGEWPAGKLQYNEHLRWRGGSPSLDVIDNLLPAEPKSGGLPPFVSAYRPKGREASPNFGKYVYQRRYRFRLVRCGYYDTPEEAATKGLRDWKDKTRAGT